MFSLKGKYLLIGKWKAAVGGAGLPCPLRPLVIVTRQSVHVIRRE